MPSSLLSHLEQRVLVLDGAMGTSVHALDPDVDRDYLGRENCPDLLVRSRPDLVQQIHESFLAAGADAVETNTFGASRHVLADFDDEAASWTRSLNREAAEIARAACVLHQTEDKPRFVIGSMGPGTKLISLGQISWPDLLASYTEQARGLIEGGVDAFMIETCQDLLQVKCVINACRDALAEAGRRVEDVPIFASITIETSGTMLLGTELAAAANALRMFPITALGLNCATGPAEMGEHVSWLSRHWDGPISVAPNAGLPVLADGQTKFPLTPDEFASAMERFVVDSGATIVGGCCGTTPEHIRRLAEVVATARPGSRVIEPPPPGCSSLYSPVDYEQDSSFLIVAERTNANGSRRFKRLLDEEDYDGLVSMAREEVRGGAHLLDVCVDFVGRDGVRDMAEVVSRFVRQVNVPLMIDSTEAPVLEAALQRAGGKCVVNSINLEDGEQRFDDVCPMLRRYGAACVALTIDEDPQAGMAKTAERKLAIATRMHDLFVEKWGLDERDLLFDPLTFTIATGSEDDRRLGAETLEGIRLIHERFPRCGILLGLSNISFGLRPPLRAVLNSVFLHEAMVRGLTSAIVHPSKILPRNRIADEHWEAAQWLIFDRRGDERPEGMPAEFDPLHHFIGLFPDEDAKEEATTDTHRTLEETLQHHIVDGDERDLATHLDAALERYSPLEIINEHLLAGMKVVGELFGSGQMQLPFVLQSASVMKKAVAHLEPHMDRLAVDAGPKARIVLATVRGDVHDIGKNLVDIILSNNGYEVINLGIKQPIAAILEAWRTHEADAIGLSGLLVKSVTVMEENLHELNEQGVTAPVLLGGAALTRHYCESRLRQIYRGPLYYGRDAFDALRICGHLVEGEQAELESEIDERLAKRARTEEKVTASRVAAAASSGGSRVVVAERTALAPAAVPAAPFLGARIVEDIDLDEIYPYINEVALFRGQWGFRKGPRSAEEYESLLEETVRPVLRRLERECREQQILRPKVAYGYFACQSDGDDLIIYDPDDATREIERFTWPRQATRDRRCIADFFRSVASGERDVIGLHCVTVGDEASRRAKTLFEANEYTEYLYLHGMGVETAEALAEYWHRRIRTELGIDGDDAAEIRKLFTQGYRGSRYSFGYPACPDLSDQEKLFRLLQPERIGCTLTENWQIDPEQSTSAIIVHHPEARYFNA
ncbi:MAG: methionine synthase [Phycisphaerales bacterium]|nr:methionine synthase [Phycisphaerae bacterium]NNF44510.1 methionine synthase [Phycisphaerales bacterium]NNM24399.1 methionine synthase [Phycisphaerales bacterium]